MSSICPACRDTLNATTTEEFVEYECACGYRAAAHRSTIDPEVRHRRRHEQAGFPAEFAGQPYERDDHNREAVAAVRAWISAYAAWRVRHADPDCGEDFPPGPAIWGRQGRGKTHLLVRLGELLIVEADCTVKFTTARRLLRDLQDFDGKADRTWADTLAVDVLLLDDFGAQRPTDWRDDQLAELIDERHSRQLPLALTTNAPPGAWEQFVDIRTVSRLRGMTAPVELDAGPDRRQPRPDLQLVPEP